MAWRVTLYLQKYWEPNSEEAWWPTRYLFEQQLKAPGCMCQDEGWKAQRKPQHHWLLLSYDLRHRVRSFIRRVSETLAVWFLCSRGASRSTFCGERRLPSCCCNTKHTKYKKTCQNSASKLRSAGDSWRLSCSVNRLRQYSSQPDNIYTLNYMSKWRWIFCISSRLACLLACYLKFLKKGSKMAERTNIPQAMLMLWNGPHFLSRPVAVVNWTIKMYFI